MTTKPISTVGLVACLGCGTALMKDLAGDECPNCGSPIE